MLKTAKERTKRVPSKKGEVCSSRSIRIEYSLNFKNVYLKSNYDITSCFKSFILSGADSENEKINHNSRICIFLKYKLFGSPWSCNPI